MSAETPPNAAAPAGAGPSGGHSEEEGGSLPGWVILLVIAALVVAAVLIAPRIDVRGGSGDPVPTGLKAELGAPSIPDPAEEGVEGATTEEEMVAGVLRYAMERRVLEQAKMELPTSSECTTSDSTTYECTVTVDDQPVRSTIQVDDVSNLTVTSGEQTVIDRDTIHYTVLEQEVVVTDRAIHLEAQQTVAESQKGDSPYDAPRCDEDLPALQVVAEGEEAEGHCYAKPNGWRAWPNWSAKLTISANSTGPNLWSD
ncbi:MULTISPECIES: hypothetical protein [unclassified Brachybacterium]|uniref:hypothetical protein n=1 Tax=unclassified Brachybacterium TaxID=2623841 RepID=UPI004033303F